MSGIKAPIFTFSHCRDVVAATSKAGGFGVPGPAWMTYAAGQIVGCVNRPVSVKSVIYEMITEYAETMKRVTPIVEE